MHTDVTAKTPTPATIELTTLGAPTVRVNGELRPVRTRKVLALLVYLAVEGGYHQRDSLAELLWPDAPPSDARAFLRNTLSYLRDTLSSPADDAPLVVRGDALALAPGAVTLDVTAVEAALRDQRRNPADPAHLKQILRRCHGPFMAGFALKNAPQFDRWLDRQREYWQGRLAALCDRLATTQELHDDLWAALATRTRAVTLAPLDERSYQQLARLHLALGNRPAARRVLADCVRLLTRELGVAPSRETALLAAQLRVPAPGIPTLNGVRADDEFPAPLIGLRPELATAAAVMARARAGHPQAIVLVGEAGSGKTRLAEEIIMHPAAAGMRVLRGRAFDSGGRLPYGVVVEAIRAALEQERAPDDLLADCWLVELSRLCPELRERYPDLAQPSDDGATAHTRLFEAVARLGAALARQSPLVVYLDDIHWADQPSLDLIQYLARRWGSGSQSILFLLTARREGLDPGLERWLAGIERELPLTRLELGRSRRVPYSIPA